MGERKTVGAGAWSDKLFFKEIAVLFVYLVSMPHLRRLGWNNRLKTR